jgi:hypothetical protein
MWAALLTYITFFVKIKFLHSNNYHLIILENLPFWKYSMWLGLNTGTGKPAVFPKWVLWGYGSELLYTAAYRAPVPRCHGYSRVKYIWMCLFIIFIITSYPLFDILMCDFQAEFETPPNVVRSSDHCIALFLLLLLLLGHGSHFKIPGKWSLPDLLLLTTINQM